MPCPICDQKPANCDCTPEERRQYSEIEDLEGEIERQRAERRWIPVDERWPAHLSDVLVAYKCGKYIRLGVGEFDGTTVNDEGMTIPYFKGIGGFEVTHWMPLPEPPEVK